MGTEGLDTVWAGSGRVSEAEEKEEAGELVPFSSHLPELQ